MSYESFIHMLTIYFIFLCVEGAECSGVHSLSCCDTGVSRCISITLKLHKLKLQIENMGDGKPSTLKKLPYTGEKMLACFAKLQ